MQPKIPHFDLPFRFVAGQIALVQQDSERDVVNCVTAILSTKKGQRLEVPTFGIVDPTFQRQPINLEALHEDVIEQEPRANAVMDQHPDLFSNMTTDITVQVSREDQSA